MAGHQPSHRCSRCNFIAIQPFVGANGNWWVGGVDLNVKAAGTDGLTPYIGTNGNWWIGETDTGVNATATPAIINYASVFNSSENTYNIDDLIDFPIMHMLQGMEQSSDYKTITVDPGDAVSERTICEITLGLSVKSVGDSSGTTPYVQLLLNGGNPADICMPITNVGWNNIDFVWNLPGSSTLSVKVLGDSITLGSNPAPLPTTSTYCITSYLTIKSIG